MHRAAPEATNASVIVRPIRARRRVTIATFPAVPLKPEPLPLWMICPEPACADPGPVDAERSDERARQRVAGRDGSRSGRGSAAGRSGSTRPRCAPTSTCSEVRLASSCDTSASADVLYRAGRRIDARWCRSWQQWPRGRTRRSRPAPSGSWRPCRPARRRPRRDAGLAERLIELCAGSRRCGRGLWCGGRCATASKSAAVSERTGMRSRDKASASSRLASL